MTVAGPPTRRERDALLPLGGLAAVAGLLVLVLLLWAAMRAGTLAGLDAAVLRGLRLAGSGWAGGPWLDRLFRDVTVLGGGRILTLVALAAAGLFAVRRRAGTGAALLVSIYGGSVLVSLLKHAVGRVRPDVVPQLVHEASASFPSAHAANSAILYLTLAALATRHEAEAAVRRYTMALAVALVLLIGVSRLYLGVHWPSDVAAGWCLGAGWAALALLAADRLLPRGAEQARRPIAHAPAPPHP